LILSEIEFKEKNMKNLMKISGLTAVLLVSLMGMAFMAAQANACFPALNCCTRSS